MIKLTSECSVAADQVAMLQRCTYDRGVHVHLKSGEVLFVQNSYAESSFKTLDNLEKKINEALK